MKRFKMSLIGLAAVAMIAGSGAGTQADAKTRVHVSLRTPTVRVDVGNTPYGTYRSTTRRHLPARGIQYYKVVHRDRRIARRLSRYTGFPARRMLAMRGRGFTWFEIGRFLDLRRPVIRAAMHARSWNHFLWEERRYARCDDHGRRRGHRATLDISHRELESIDEFKDIFDD